MKVRSKICGITRPEDARTAAALGADAVGLVFYEGSKRCVNAEQALEIVRALPPFVSAVGLFVNADTDFVNDILAQVPLDILQFHGDEDAAFCRQFGRPYLKAVRVRGAADFQTAFDDFPDARGILFDAFVDGAYGGTGHCFDWSLLPDLSGRPWILSGGLTPQNAAAAIAATSAPAVDISSGVETAPGIKCAEKTAAFLAALK